MDRESTKRIAAQLESAWLSGIPVPPVAPDLVSIDHAYAVQRLVVDALVRLGDRVIGRKIGLTSTAMQAQLGVDQPDFGCLLESRKIEAVAGVARAARGRFIAPRIEGELAFRIARPLPPGSQASTHSLLRVTRPHRPSKSSIAASTTGRSRSPTRSLTTRRSAGSSLESGRHRCSHPTFGQFAAG